jgi:hypothetical protein
MKRRVRVTSCSPSVSEAVTSEADPDAPREDPATSESVSCEEMGPTETGLDDDGAAAGLREEDEGVGGALTRGGGATRSSTCVGASSAYCRGTPLAGVKDLRGSLGFPIPQPSKRNPSVHADDPRVPMTNRLTHAVREPPLHPRSSEKTAALAHLRPDRFAAEIVDRQMTTKAAPFLLLLIVACQSPPKPPEAAVVAPADVSAPTTPPAVASVANAPPRTTGESECKIACARYGECAPDVPNAKSACESDCVTFLFAHDPDAPKRYGSCLEKLDCRAIKMSLMMNEGPAGRCYPRLRSRETTNH